MSAGHQISFLGMRTTLKWFTVFCRELIVSKPLKKVAHYATMPIYLKAKALLNAKLLKPPLFCLITLHVHFWARSESQQT